MSRRIVVVGASLAGATAATTLRERGYDGELVLVGAEPHLPYERPALSKDFLGGTTGDDDLLVHAGAVYADLGITLRLGVAATGLDADAQTVSLADGSTEAYDALLVTTGSVNRTPDLPGTELAGVHQLRTLDDARALRADLTSARTAVVLGAGFIGCEVAATLRTAGLTVTMVDRVAGPLLGPLGPLVSETVRSWHTGAGTTFLGSVGVTAVEGEGGRVRAVLLDDGRRLPADLVVVGVGARPATDWLAGSAVALDDAGAVLVDALGRSSAAGVYAAGDVCARLDTTTGDHRRVEHYDSAVAQGQAVAHAVLGLRPPTAGPSWFWTDQLGHVLQYSGHHAGDDELLLRPGGVGFYGSRGSGDDLDVRAVVAVDSGRDFRRALGLLGRRRPVAALLDPTVDLRALAASSPSGTADAIGA